MDLLNGQKKKEKRVKDERTFWKMWSEDLPAGFPKRRLIDALEWRWQLSGTNVRNRLKKEELMFMRSDIRFMYVEYGIAFNLEKGFFLDQKQYEALRDREDMEAAAIYGMTKVLS